MAVAGIGLGGLFAVVVILGGLVAFVRGDPLLLTGWLVLFSAGFPIAGAAFSYVAMVRIQRSEGTLAGEKLARWGLLISVLVGLSYWAYVIATYIAIGQDAGRFADRFLTDLKNDDVLTAFSLTLKPDERPQGKGAALRPVLESRFNLAADGGPVAPLTAFSQTEYVRLIGQGGAATQVEALGVEEWKYIGGGYQVGLLYQVSTPYITFPMLITVEGKDSPDSGERGWHIVWDRTSLRDKPMPSMTEEGKRMLPLSMVSRQMFLHEWLEQMREGKAEEVFLGTLPVPERAAVAEAANRRRLGLALLNATGLGATPAEVATRALLAADRERSLALVEPRFQDFLNGGMVQAEAPTYWAPDAIKEDVVRLLRQEFRGGLPELSALMVPEMRARFLRTHVEGDRYVVEHDFSGRLPRANPRYVVEGRLVVDCAMADVTNVVVKDWRARSVVLVSAKPAPVPPTGPMDQRRPMPR